MNEALQKTFELLLIILIGIILQKKVLRKEQLDGVKAIILNVALPATIFLALLKVRLEQSLLILPLLALAFNVFLFFGVRYILRFSFSIEHTSRKRTLALLLPSMAPGLSCFPFIITYLDDESLALAALADVGNKFFGLILLYLLAMRWYQKNKMKVTVGTSTGSGLKKLLLTLFREPINVVIFLALGFLVLGINPEVFPEFISGAILRFSSMMVALVLLFIGMAVRVRWSEVRKILMLLSWRSGMALLFSALCLFILPGLTPAMMLLLVVMPQSSCSFWPFAHMTAVGTLEQNDGQTNPTFDTDYAINILACSLPFSTVMIITQFHFRDFFTNPWMIFALGTAFIGVTFTGRLYRYFQGKTKSGIWEEVSA